MRQTAKGIAANYNLYDLFTEDFMKKYTDFNSLADLFEELGLASDQEFDDVDKERLDKLIGEKTRFKDYEMMLDQAEKEKKKL